MRKNSSGVQRKLGSSEAGSVRRYFSRLGLQRRNRLRISARPASTTRQDNADQRDGGDDAKSVHIGFPSHCAGQSGHEWAQKDGELVQALSGQKEPSGLTSQSDQVNGRTRARLLEVRANTYRSSPSSSFV
jgi:hypothetical protein